jgi:hypothetical protein
MCLKMFRSSSLSMSFQILMVKSVVSRLVGRIADLFFTASSSRFCIETSFCINCAVIKLSEVERDKIVGSRS